VRYFETTSLASDTLSVNMIFMFVHFTHAQKPIIGHITSYTKRKYINPRHLGFALAVWPCEGMQILTCVLLYSDVEMD
jgi:hypothetical protein